MNHRYFDIDEPTYQAMLSGLNGLHHTDQLGQAIDSIFLYRDDWLSDTAVAERLIKRRGQVQIHLVFAYALNPFRFLSRYITTCADPRRASMMGAYFRRLAAKDQRGTIVVDAKQWVLPPN